MKEFNLETINEILENINKFVWTNDLIIKHTYINQLQEWVEVVAIDYTYDIVLKFSVSKYGLFYYNNTIYTLDEITDYLDTPEYQVKFN